MIKINNLTKKYNSSVIYENFNLNIELKKITCILGPSGCGKTTLLNILSKNEEATSGEVFLGNNTVSYAFQEATLLEHLTVYKNLEIFLRRFYHRSNIKEKIEEILLDLEVLDLKDRYPRDLSGGQAQRINIARSILYPSNIILMDEPFKSLDEKTKYKVMDKIKNIIKKENRTLIMVTHSIDEAKTIGEDIIRFYGQPLKYEKLDLHKL